MAVRWLAKARLLGPIVILLGGLLWPPTQATAGAIDHEQLIGTTGCPAAGQDAADWDTMAECQSTNGTWKRGPYFIGSTSDTCDSNHAGMMQWTGSAFEYCNGSAWLSTVTSTPIGTGYLVFINDTYNACLSVPVSSITSSGTTATVTTSVMHSLPVGAYVTVTGVTPTAYDGLFQVTSVPSNTTFTYTMGSSPGSSGSAKAGQSSGVTITATGSTATVTTSSPHNLATGDVITVTGATVASGNNYYNAASAITVTSSTTFTYVLYNTPATSPAGGTPVYTVSMTYCFGNTPAISSITNSGTTATLTTSSAHGLSVGQIINVSGTTPSAYSGQFQIASVPSSTTATYVMASTPSGSATVLGSYFPAGVGMAQADQMCLDELTTHTNWKGYSTANANGQLIASKVHAMGCSSTDCRTFTPNTTYYFASTANSSYGGASFTTTPSGDGPGNTTSWNGSTYFGVTSAVVWENMYSSGTAGDYVSYQLNGGCNDYTTDYGFGNVGYTNGTGYGRWTASGRACNTYGNFICMVNP